jgi:hypothetical protein
VFTKKVFLKVAHMMAVLDPPKILITFLQHFDVILEKTDPSIHASKVNQIIANSLKSNDAVFLKAHFKKLPALMQFMPETAIQIGVLCQLPKVCEKSQDLEYVVTALNCVVRCLAKVNHDLFIKLLVPKFKEISKHHLEPIIIQCLSELLIALRGVDIPTMAYTIPFAAEIAGDPMCDRYYPRLLVSRMLAFVTKFKSSGAIEEVEDRKPKQAVATWRARGAVRSARRAAALDARPTDVQFQRRAARVIAIDHFDLIDLTIASLLFR